MKEIPCILWNASKNKKTEDIELLKQISITQKIPEKSLADYSAILARTYNIFDKEGYSLEEIRDCNLNKRKNYCSLYEKKDPIHTCLCQTCFYSKNYLGRREQQEKAVLYHLIDDNEDVILYQGIEKNMFVSKKIIKMTDSYGKWPIIKFNQEIYNFIFISFFSGSEVNRDSFLERFLQYIHALLPGLSKGYGKEEGELKEAFVLQAKIFIGGYRDVNETEYEDALELIKHPYQSHKKETGNKITQQNLREEEKINEKEQKAAENLSVIFHVENKDNEWFEKYPLPFKKSDITVVSPKQTASLEIKLVRAGYIAIEAGIADGQEGLLIYPMHSENIYFTGDKKEMEHILARMGDRMALHCFDIKMFYAFLRKQGIMEKQRIDSVSLLYRSFAGTEKVSKFPAIAVEVLGENPKGLHDVLLGECRLYRALLERLMGETQKLKYRKRIIIERAFSYSYAYNGCRIVKLQECSVFNYASFRGIKVEVKGYGKWKELIHEVMGRLWSCGAFDIFQMHLGDIGDDYAVFYHLLHNSAELVDLFCHVFHASLEGNKGDGYEVIITEKYGA